MKFVVRKDLGGYGARLTVPEVEIEKPFVLLSGPNGSGKTSVLAMIRNALGLKGEREGRWRDAHFMTSAAHDDHDDLGRLVGSTKGWGNEEAGLERDSAGLLDVVALGWHGQRTWLYDSRHETARIKASTFEDDFADHVQAIMGSRAASHGQSMRHAWHHAMAWAAGALERPDPYDAPNGLPDNLRSLHRRLVPATGRPEERWLLVDEPETAIDADALLAGLSVMLANAETGRLRVFCASHSPVFAAGLGEHPKVQVVVLGKDGKWFESQASILAMAKDHARLAATGKALSARIEVGMEKARKEAEARERKEAAEELERDARHLSAKERKLVLDCAAAGGTLALEDGFTAMRANHSVSRGNVLERDEEAGTVSLTEKGKTLAAFLEAKAASRKAKRTRNKA